MEEYDLDYAIAEIKKEIPEVCKRQINYAEEKRVLWVGLRI